MMRALGGILFTIAVVMCIVLWLVISLPATAEYNKLFASHVTMAYDQATFDGIRTQVNIVWTQMNTSFAGDDFSTTYNTPWYWNQNYDNSLSAQQDYFKQLNDRIDLYESTYNLQRLNNTQPTLLTDWYDKSIQNLRVEMDREGGLDWAIHDAWLLNKRPLAYWSVFLYGFAVFIGLIGLLMMLAGGDYW
jgi:hypothetical protein